MNRTTDTGHGDPPRPSLPRRTPVDPPWSPASARMAGVGADCAARPVRPLAVCLHGCDLESVYVCFVCRIGRHGECVGPDLRHDEVPGIVHIGCACACHRSGENG